MEISKARKLVWWKIDQMEREWEEERRGSWAVNRKHEDIWSWAGGGGLYTLPTSIHF